MAFAIALHAETGAILWTDPGPVESLDIVGGPGGHAKAPKAPFTFQKEEPGGTAPKVEVRDARGATWSVKFGPEVKAETFATRLAWLAGYFAEPTYYIAQGTIEGAGKIGRAAQYIDADGRFRDARFELRNDPAYRFIQNSSWTLDEKALKGTKELSGLKLVLMLVSNWDVKPENTAMVEMAGKRYYAWTDWGASMGLTGDISGRSKWDCAGFARQSEYFVDEIGDGYVTFTYAGKNRDVVGNGIRVDDVKWFMARMSKLKDAQIRAGLQASGANAEETSCFANALSRRLAQLRAAAEGAGRIRTRTVIKTRTVTPAGRQ